MDEQTFRRLAPDAVAGRLDPATYERWKDAAGEAPDRANFVVRVVEADARISQQRPAVGPAPVATSSRVPRARFLALAVIFGALGLLAGGMVMHSFLRNQERTAPPTNAETAQTPQAPTNAGNTTGEPPRNEPQPEPEPEPKPEPEPEPEPPQPEPQPDTALLRLVAAAEPVSVRGTRDSEWKRLETGQPVPSEVSLSSRASIRLHSDTLEIFASGPLHLELAAGAIRFVEGRACVRVSGPRVFSCYKQAWSLSDGSFIVEPRRLGGELFLLDGGASLGTLQLTAPVRVMLDGTRDEEPVSGDQLGRLEFEALGPHHRLLFWDCETEATRPELGELRQPGALGDGHCVARDSGQPGIGVSASAEVFKSESNARLRMRVKTTASTVRLELRVRLDEGFRVVDARIDTQGNDRWQTIDIPMSTLRAGRFRAEPGWLPGRVYSALLLTPAVDPENPLARHELLLDDVLIYVPD